MDRRAVGACVGPPEIQLLRGLPRLRILAAVLFYANNSSNRRGTDPKYAPQALPSHNGEPARDSPALLSGLRRRGGGGARRPAGVDPGRGGG